ncbi:GlxA family transcriptional regulator [Pedobacter sp. GSP4]|uniref:GlxA family transcriptional regulator n=1 Tax=Pedobacter sp. GSP4 TaxID=3453716 RepID=UPI003EEE0ADB
MIQVGVLIPKNFRLLSIAAILDVFDTVNGFYRTDGLETPFAISLITLDDQQYDFSGHPSINLQKTAILDLILVPSFATSDIKACLAVNKSYLPWLNKQHRAGAEIATFCTGAFLLAASGLLNGKVATTHVDACAAFSTAFPQVHLKADKTVTQDGKLFTSGGATSTFHLLLHLLQLHCGKEMAVKVAKIFAIDMDRVNQLYFSTFQPIRHHNDDIVASAQEKIENSYQDVATIEEMIKDIPSSRRNIVRRFKQVIGITPIEYLQQTRVEAAKKLLEQTAQQMTEVIYNSGYNDPKAFRKVFRKAVGMTPTQYRDKFQSR